MQRAFGFAKTDLVLWRQKLGPVALPPLRRAPVGQLVKSLISARTRDAISLAAYHRLARRYVSASLLTSADQRDVARVISDVTFADAKAAYLVATLRQIAADEGNFRLAHLANESIGGALTWLERFPGVARKVAASTLNASILSRPVMIVDTHVLRVLRRLGFVGKDDFRFASEAVTAAMPEWSGDDFLGFHIALKRLGQTVCRWDVPVCSDCPLAADCPSAQVMT